MPDAELRVLMVIFRPCFRVVFTLDRTCVQENLATFISEVHTLFCKNYIETDIAIYMDESVVHNLRIAWNFTFHCGGRIFTWWLAMKYSDDELPPRPH